MISNVDKDKFNWCTTEFA